MPSIACITLSKTTYLVRADVSKHNNWTTGASGAAAVAAVANAKMVMSRNAQYISSELELALAGGNARIERCKYCSVLQERVAIMQLASGQAAMMELRSFFFSYYPVLQMMGNESSDDVPIV